MSIVVGLIGGLGEKGLTDTLVRGAGDFIGVGLIIVLARGVTVIMNNSQITDTVLHSMENAVNNTSSGVFGALMFLINLPLAFLVPSTSGHAALAMPILAPLADFAGVQRAMVVTAFQSASGVDQPDHADLRGGHGRAGAGQGALRPVPAVHRPAAAGPGRAVHRVRRRRSGGRLTHQGSRPVPGGTFAFCATASTAPGGASTTRPWRCRAKAIGSSSR